MTRDKVVDKFRFALADVAQQLQGLLISTARNTGFNMAIFPVAEAAKRAGVERTTLYRKLKKGEISAHSDSSGNKFIEASELLRVYPKADLAAGFATADQQLQASGLQQRATVNENSLLQREIKVRDERVSALEQERERERRDAQATIDDLRRRLDQEAEERRRLTLMLIDQRESALTVPQEATEGRFARAWGILRGKG
jgi:excisionase family DNA binding protein